LLLLNDTWNRSRQVSSKFVVFSESLARNFALVFLSKIPTENKAKPEHQYN
jgi:hypothetical protein